MAEVMEQVIDKIAGFLYHTKYATRAWLIAPSELKEYYRAQAKQLLKDNPEILIKDPNQSLPNPSGWHSAWYYRGQEDMRDKEHWVKVLPKEAK